MVAMVAVSCSGQLAGFVPPPPPPPFPRYEERVYELAWADVGGEGPVPDSRGIDPVARELVGALWSTVLDPRPLPRAPLLGAASRAERVLPRDPAWGRNPHAHTAARAFWIADAWSTREALTFALDGWDIAGAAQRDYGLPLELLDDPAIALLLSGNRSRARAERLLAAAAHAPPDWSEVPAPACHEP